jgi:hypothetical protein
VLCVQLSRQHSLWSVEDTFHVYGLPTDPAVLKGFDCVDFMAIGNVSVTIEREACGFRVPFVGRFLALHRTTHPEIFRLVEKYADHKGEVVTPADVRVLHECVRHNVKNIDGHLPDGFRSESYEILKCYIDAIEWVDAVLQC